MNARTISIVLPTRNGMGTLPAVFEALARQRVDAAVEIVVVDSSSTDGTPEFVQSHADRFVSIPAERFNHGTTRNLGVEQARGDLVVLLVQDAVPVSTDWLEQLAAPLDDPAVAGSFARQSPREDASAVTRYYAERWHLASAKARSVSVDRHQYYHLSPMEQFERCTFDNVCSCVRRSAWVEHPFRPTAIAEDLEWARDVLLAGYRLAFAADARVVHSHERSAAYEFERTRLLHRRLYELFGVRTIPAVSGLVHAAVASTWQHVKLEAAEAGRHRGKRMARGLALGLAWPLGQYLGGREGATQARERSWLISSQRV